MGSRNGDHKVVYLDRYGITLNAACYLVTVSNANSARLNDAIEELPDWVFNSKHTIWLTDEEKPIAVRARHGDQIRKRLLALRTA